ncbi:putative histidine acid phosphatase [Aulographum hederae CBS 113979]|uniref:Putative histidine acid phosphatase n=1 Tax=Aulographum hederae CBS 113979 TaxID=1176131 RepID=A0A6G1H375_9PEZI|nr:putative histidine acid phosphatase [Aulographum hederae CBS 113979]
MRSGLSVLLVAKFAASAFSYSFNPLEHLAGIAPYFEPSDPPLDPSPPQGCNVTRAAYLVRHAAIYANDFDFEEYIEPFVQKLANASVNWSRTRDLAFLATWKSPIGEKDEEQLTQVGELEAQKLGVEVLQRYPNFKPPKKVWTSTAERTTKSAESFISGLVRYENETEMVQVYEGKEAGANSLTPYSSCPAYSGSRGSDQSKPFQTRYTAPIIERLKAQAPGFNFTNNDIVGMQELCGYETVIRGSSPFCSLSLFTPNDWLGFEYANDLMYHYNTGYGFDVSGAIGMPWVTATTQQLLSDGVGNAVANPEGELQDLYVSFTHRELPPTVIVALGLFNNSAFSSSGDVNATMPTDTINHNRAWKSSNILPFLTNVAVEKMECDSYGYGQGEYFRVLVNKSPQSLPGCNYGPGESCPRNAFVEFISRREAMFGGFGQKCGVDYGNSTDTLGIYSSAQ